MDHQQAANMYQATDSKEYPYKHKILQAPTKSFIHCWFYATFFSQLSSMTMFKLGV
jgi:hypothetical protein